MNKSQCLEKQHMNEPMAETEATEVQSKDC